MEKRTCENCFMSEYCDRKGKKVCKDYCTLEERIKSVFHGNLKLWAQFCREWQQSTQKLKIGGRRNAGNK